MIRRNSARLGVALVALLLAWLYGAIGLPPTPPGPTFVDPSVELPDQPDDEVRILILGTSLTAYGNWTTSLSEALSGCPNRRVDVEVLARPGASSQWGLRILEKRLQNTSKPKPHLIVAEFSINDAVLVKGLPVFLSARNHRRMIELAKAKGAKTVLATMNPAWSFEAWQRPGQRRYQGLYRDLAGAHGVGLIDTIQAWSKLSKKERETAVPDGLHPTDRAMQSVILPAFVSALNTVLCSD